MFLASQDTKWNIRWLRLDDLFQINGLQSIAVAVDWWPENGYLDFGDGLWVRGEEVAPGTFRYLLSVWARSEDHFRYFCLSNEGHPTKFPDPASYQYPEPPGTLPLTYGAIIEHEQSAGRVYHEDGLFHGRNFHHKILQTKSDSRENTGFYFCERRAKDSETCSCVTWRYR